MSTPAIAPGSADTLLTDFTRDGLAFAERLLTPAQVAAAGRGVAWAMAHAGGPYAWIKQRTYEWREHPIFAELIEHPAVIGFARGLLGEDFHLIAAQCSRNTREDPYAPGAMAIHADEVFYPRPERKAAGVADDRYSFSAMWYVQDTPLAMGPTEFVPGSHTAGKRYTDSELTPDRLWRRAIPAGSLILFNHRTWHRGARNATGTPRDLITNAYARPEVEKVQLTVKGEDGRERYAVPEGLLEDASPMLKMLLRKRP